MTELQPCPFCGATASFALTGGWFAHCTQCDGRMGGDGSGYSTQDAAADAWNRRTLALGPTAQVWSDERIDQALNKCFGVMALQPNAVLDLLRLVRDDTLTAERQRRMALEIANTPEPAPTPDGNKMKLWSDSRIKNEIAAISIHHESASPDWHYRSVHAVSASDAETLMLQMRDEYEQRIATLEARLGIIMIKCPMCGVEQEDLDGFGVVDCEACGYCTHFSITGGVCDTCGKVVDPQPAASP